MGSNLFENAISQLVSKRSNPISGMASLFPIRLTEASKSVNTQTSLTISAFYAAVNTVANSLALLPMSVYLKKDNTNKHQPDHSIDYLLYRKPNNYMTAFVFKFIMAVAVMMRGNAYALIVRNGAGQVASLQFIDPDQVSVIDYEGKLWYRIKGNLFSSDEILHIPGFSFDGVCGRSVLEYAADNLGVSLYAQKFGSDSLQDRGISQGVLESELSVKLDKKKEISKAFSDAMSSGQKHRAPLLDEGMKYKPITLKPAEAQFIETYASGVSDVARWFQMPAHKLAIPGEGGYNFLTQMEIDYLHRAVMPFAEKFKQEFEVKLFTSTEIKQGFHIHQNFKKLLQVDPKARGQFYKDLTFVKAINPNEIRQLEDMNPYDGGDEFLQMSNLLNEQQLKKQIENEQGA
ncbi:phage portal protein [Mesonia aquimarina]|uniref:phage portal protein n=1 Tax=Mesonia aquimarina TaxID=1504967 RepID=UPI000EF56E7C|nr:phage portal protein [Mesonia aquimarina]